MVKLQICHTISWSKMVQLATEQRVFNELERVQKRAMRIIFPGHSYDEALQLANCTRLSDRRNETCINTLQKIAKRAGPLAEHVPQSRACAQQYYIRNLNNL